MRFKAGEVIPANDGDVKVAMILGVDGEHIDVISVSGDEVYEILLRIREAVELAIEGYMTKPER